MTLEKSAVARRFLIGCAISGCPRKSLQFFPLILLLPDLAGMIAIFCKDTPKVKLNQPMAISLKMKRVKNVKS